MVRDIILTVGLFCFACWAWWAALDYTYFGTLLLPTTIESWFVTVILIWVYLIAWFLRPEFRRYGR